METLSKESLSLLESLIQTGSSSFGDGIAERITDYLEQNLEQNVSLDMLAQSMNYSAAYLSRLIKKNTGQSFSSCNRASTEGRLSLFSRDAEYSLNAD